MKRLLLILLLILLLTGCSISTDKTTSIKSYENFSNLIISDPSEQLTQDYSVYYLYYFQETCSHCNFIKNEVLSKIELLENDVVFLIDVHGVNDIAESINVTHTPSIVKIVDHKVEYVKEGPNPVLEVINSLS